MLRRRKVKMGVCAMFNVPWNEGFIITEIRMQVTEEKKNRERNVMNKQI